MPVDMELEAVLRPQQYDIPPYPPKVITLANGKKLVVRQITREEVPALLKSVILIRVAPPLSFPFTSNEISADGFAGLGWTGWSVTPSRVTAIFSQYPSRSSGA